MCEPQWLCTIPTGFWPTYISEIRHRWPYRQHSDRTICDILSYLVMVCVYYRGVQYFGSLAKCPKNIAVAFPRNCHFPIHLCSASHRGTSHLCVCVCLRNFQVNLHLHPGNPIWIPKKMAWEKETPSKYDQKIDIHLRFQGCNFNSPLKLQSIFTGNMSTLKSQPSLGCPRKLANG